MTIRVYRVSCRTNDITVVIATITTFIGLQGGNAHFAHDLEYALGGGLAIAVK